MKRIKKLLGFFCAFALILGMNVIPASAEGTTYSITINNSTEGHTYEAYQIFTGDLSGTTLSNVVWGSGVSEEGQTYFGVAATKAEALKNEADAKAFAKAVAPYLTTAAGSASTVTDGKYVISNLTAGYYLVKDQDGSLTGDSDSYTEYIIKVVSDTTATPKSDVPTVEKKTKDTNDSTGVTSDWQDSADYDIGDSVPFQLKATLANNVSSYTTYKVVFYDTLSKGLTYKNDAKVYIDGEETDGFTVTATENEDGTTTLTVSCNDVKALGAANNSVITVEYTAKLNNQAEIGSTGNPNKVKLEYSNNPNKSEVGNNETGNTPEDVVVVFSYKVIVNKVDSENKPLIGAAFKLEKKIKGENGAEDTWIVVNEFTVDSSNPASSFEFSGLDDGEYRLTETVTPAGYNTIAPIEFAITATDDGKEITNLNGDGNNITFNSNTTEGSLSADVVNKAGVTLPSTGGMGTTLFYVAGAGLVLVAVVLLITRKRMN
ncbi:MAG: SpaH/EbpB family LPXTG-anchored major pilin [Floccifex porci]|uniref:SpaH/EbpB family LPXTG-anchored major pilin n=1 Tax=Floccifex porci TaxID=2606629 RepID=UPI003F000C89